MACTDFSNFGLYFEQNMNAIGLPTSTELFGSTAAAYANIKELSEAVSLYGRHVTVHEVWGGTGKLEKLRLLGPVAAAFYTGAAIGSSAVALGKTLGCGSTIIDALTHARNNGIYDSWVEAELLSHPEFINPIG